MGQVNDAGGVVPVAVADVHKAAVLLCNRVLAEVDAEIVLRLRIKQAVDHVREAVGVVIERGHHLGQKTRGKIAVIPEIGDVIVVRQIHELLVQIAALRLGRGQNAHHQMRVLVMGIGQNDLLGVAKLETAHQAVPRQLPGGFLLRQEHHHRHLVGARAVIPGVRVVVPALPGLGVNVADADMLPVKTVGVEILLHDLFKLRLVDQMRAALLGEGLGECQHQQSQKQRQEAFSALHVPSPSPESSSKPSPVQRTALAKNSAAARSRQAVSLAPAVS